MQFYYGDQNILRALDEAEFWKMQESEHADLIPLVTPTLEPEYVTLLHQYRIAFSDTQAETISYIASITRSKGMVGRELKMQMLQFIKECIEQSQSFVEFIDSLLTNSHAVKGNPSSQEVIRHMIRESRYFVGIAQLILQ